jgi:hypothetical protein
MAGEPVSEQDLKINRLIDATRSAIGRLTKDVPQAAIAMSYMLDLVEELARQIQERRT